MPLWDSWTSYDKHHESLFRSYQQLEYTKNWLAQGVPAQAILEWLEWQKTACIQIDMLRNSVEYITEKRDAWAIQYCELSDKCDRLLEENVRLVEEVARLKQMYHEDTGADV